MHRRGAELCRGRQRRGWKLFVGLFFAGSMVVCNHTDVGRLFGSITLDDAPLAEPAVLGAFKENGECVGFALPILVDGVSYVSLTLYGDDPTTDIIDGMSMGDAFALLLYLADSNTTLTFQSNGTTASLGGWSNTNGAPMAGYNDPVVTYNFTLLSECSDSTACNFNPESTSDEECEYPDIGYNCDGSCQALDECGVCGGAGIPLSDCDCDGNHRRGWRLWRQLHCRSRRRWHL